MVEKIFMRIRSDTVGDFQARMKINCVVIKGFRKFVEVSVCVRLRN